MLLFICSCAQQNVSNAQPDMRPLPASSTGLVPGGSIGSAVAGQYQPINDQQRFANWVAAFRVEAMGKGVSAQVLDEAFAGMVPSQKVLDHDHTQPEQTKSFADYLKGVVNDKKIDKAKDMQDSHSEVLARIEAQYGVPAPMLLALWGVESNFGRIQGHYAIINSLATLAYDGRRSEFFRKELIDALLIVQQEHMPPANLTGSWAGAMGQTQFMPSSFLVYAVDFDGTGQRDIWNSDSDALASIANYLHSKGWDPKTTWGIQVKLPLSESTDWASVANQEKPIRDWRALGITRMDGRKLSKSQTVARLVLPDGDPDYAYLTFANYKVIMDWNHSTYFATAVGLLADRIKKP